MYRYVRGRRVIYVGTYNEPVTQYNIIYYVIITRQNKLQDYIPICRQ